MGERLRDVGGDELANGQTRNLPLRPLAATRKTAKTVTRSRNMLLDDRFGR